MDNRILRDCLLDESYFRFFVKGFDHKGYEGTLCQCGLDERISSSHMAKCPLLDAERKDLLDQLGVPPEQGPELLLNPGRYSSECARLDRREGDGFAARMIQGCVRRSLMLCMGQ